MRYCDTSTRVTLHLIWVTTYIFNNTQDGLVHSWKRDSLIGSHDMYIVFDADSAKDSAVVLDRSLTPPRESSEQIFGQVPRLTRNDHGEGLAVGVKMPYEIHGSF